MLPGPGRGWHVAAAQSFFVFQSTLSSALKEVEAETGVVIFNRTSCGVEATLEGHSIHRWSMSLLSFYALR
ncbi:MAG: LysR family transcriptional regulator [Eggerthellaceae bacterium]